MFNVLKEPDFIQAVYNKIEVEVQDTGYTVGDLYFLEVYTVSGDSFTNSQNSKSGSTLLVTFTKNGGGDGSCIFDLSNALSTQLTNYYTPASDLLLQVDKTAYNGYYYKTGTISYDPEGLQVKNYEFESEVKFVLRSAYELDSTEEASDYAVNYTSEAKFLTAIPDGVEVKKDEATFLPVLLPFRESTSAITISNRVISLKASFYYSDGTSELDQEVSSTGATFGGIFIYNVKPSLLLSNPVKLLKLVKYDVWVEYADSESVVYYSTATYTASCPSGYTGSAVSKTVTASGTTQSEADSNAATQAQQEAEAELVCTQYFTSTQSYTANCPSGYSGTSVTKTATATGTTQSEADTIAYNQAQDEAEAELVCESLQPVVSVNKVSESSGATSYTMTYSIDSTHDIMYKYAEEENFGSTSISHKSGTGLTANYSKTVNREASDYTFKVYIQPPGYVGDELTPDYAIGTPSAITYTIPAKITYSAVNLMVSDVYNLKEDACAADHTLIPLFVVYTVDGELTIGNDIYQDSAGAVLLYDGYYKVEDGNTMQVLDGKVNDIPVSCSM